MSDLANALLVLGGFGLGALALLASVFFLALRLLWNVFGQDAVSMLGDAWRNRLSSALRVAPPPLPALRPEVRAEDRPS